MHHLLEAVHVDVRDVAHHQDGLLHLAGILDEVVHRFQGIVILLTLLIDFHCLLKVLSHVGRRGRCVRHVLGGVHDTLRDIGRQLNTNLTEINTYIPAEYSDEIRQLQNKDNFNLQFYINSYINGDAVKDDGIDSENFNFCQARLLEIQDYLKKTALEIEERLK